MNKIWTVIMLVSIAILAFTMPETVMPSMLNAGNEAVKLSFNLMGIYVIWMGIMSIVEATGAGKLFGRLLKPFTRLVLGTQDEETYNYFSLNISANLFGMGNAATPMGIKTIESLKPLNDGSASDAMIMVMVINATSLQLIPTTTIAIRASLGSSSASDTILPTLIATFISTMFAIILARLCAGVSRRIKKRKQKKLVASNLQAI